MSDPRTNHDLEDRQRNQVTADTVGTAATASVNGAAPEGTDGEKRLTAPAGAAGGAAAGLTAGMVVLGPIGAIVGAIAGAVGGGWAGLASGASAASGYDETHDRTYRAHYESDAHRHADRSWEDARVAYQLGHLAAANPDYAERGWGDVEADLRRGWSDDAARQHGGWEHASRYARIAYERQRGQAVTQSVAQPEAQRTGRGFIEREMAGTESHQRASFSDPIPAGDPDGVAGERGIPGREE